MPIDRTSSFSLLGDLRLRGSSKAKRGSRTGAQDAAADAKPASPAASTPRSMAALRQSVAAVLQDVDIGDADAVLARRDPVLRTIVLWEFGADFRGDPQFLPMIDELSRAIAQNADLQARFTAMVASLKSR